MPVTVSLPLTFKCSAHLWQITWHFFCFLLTLPPMSTSTRHNAELLFKPDYSLSFSRFSGIWSTNTSLVIIICDRLWFWFNSFRVYITAFSTILFLRGSSSAVLHVSKTTYTNPSNYIVLLHYPKEHIISL